MRAVYSISALRIVVQIAVSVLSAKDRVRISQQKQKQVSILIPDRPASRLPRGGAAESIAAAMWKLAAERYKAVGRTDMAQALCHERSAMPRTERRASNGNRWHRVGVCAGAGCHDAVADGSISHGIHSAFCPEKNQVTPVSLCRSGSFCTEAILHNKTGD